MLSTLRAEPSQTFTPVSNMDGTVLVTGGCGFLGSHIVDALIRDGNFRVVAVSRDPTKFCNSQASYVACDITQHDKVAAVIEQLQPIAIIHAASPGPFALNSVHDKDHVATQNLIDISTKTASIRAFVYSGSVEAIQNISGASTKPLSETEAILHTSATATTGYANAKSASDTLVRNASAKDLATAVLRLPAIYGPRENQKMGLTSNCILLTNTPGTRLQLGPNKVLHDWIYVESAAHAHVLALKALLGAKQSQIVSGQGYFITDGTPIKLWDFVHRVWRAAGDEKSAQGDLFRIVIPWWTMVLLAQVTEFVFRILTLGRIAPQFSMQHLNYMMKGSWCDVSKARRELGYEPIVSTDEGIERTVGWMKEIRNGKGKQV